MLLWLWGVKDGSDPNFSGVFLFFFRSMPLVRARCSVSPRPLRRRCCTSGRLYMLYVAESD